MKKKISLLSLSLSLSLSLIHEILIILLTCAIRTRSIIKRERTNERTSSSTVLGQHGPSENLSQDCVQGSCMRRWWWWGWWTRKENMKKEYRTHLYLFSLLVHTLSLSLSLFLLSESLRLLCKDEQRRREREYYSHTQQLREVPRTAERKIFNEPLIACGP
jgi:hypothetical protein